MRKLWGTFALTLVLLATLFSYELNADGTSSSSSSSSTPTGNCTNAGGQSQLGQYCGSSQSAKQGSDADSSLWKVWGGVSVVCIHACMAGGGGVAGTAACNIDTQGGSVTDGVVNKNYSSGLTSIAQTQGTSTLSSQLSGQGKNAASDADDADKTPAQQAAADQKASAEKAKKAKASACTGAIAAAGKAMSDYRTMQNSTQSAETTKKAAASLDSGATEASGGSVNGVGTASRGNVEGSGKEGSSAASAGGVANICASARQTSNTSETIQCAVSSDRSLPSLVTSGQLPAAFTKASGTDFSSFGSNPSQSPADAIAQAAGGSLSTSDGLKVAALLKGMEGDLMANDGAYYASGGGGGNSGQSGDQESAQAQSALQDQLKEMLAKSQGAPGEEQASNGISAVIYANQNRAPASVAEDKTLSIFDRVTYRYYFVVKQLRVENFQ